jgi:hypothetical protein
MKSVSKNFYVVLALVAMLFTAVSYLFLVVVAIRGAYLYWKWHDPRVIVFLSPFAVLGVVLCMIGSFTLRYANRRTGKLK